MRIKDKINSLYRMLRLRTDRDFSPTEEEIEDLKEEVELEEDV